MSERAIEAAEVLLPAPDFPATLAFFTGELGFRLDLIRPADEPSVAVVSGHGVCLRLDRDGPGPPGALRLTVSGLAAADELVAPNGTRIERVPATDLELPALVPSFVLQHATDEREWTRGRAGMRYRELLPDRQGGRFVASLIRIAAGGPVEDWVHWHRVRFQLIFVLQGRVRVVYEDQGPPFWLEAGDCVLQPPGIRHRVLESSAGLEVLEMSSPAVHDTQADHELELPTPSLAPERKFGGQGFVRHRASAATWGAACEAGFEQLDTGIGLATKGLGSVRILRRTTDALGPVARHDRELAFTYVRSGTATLVVDERLHRIAAGDAFQVPAGALAGFTETSTDVELIVIEVSAGATDPS